VTTAGSSAESPVGASLVWPEVLPQEGDLFTNDIVEATAREHVEVLEWETDQVPVRRLRGYLYSGGYRSDVVVITDADEQGAVDLASSASWSVSWDL
jgi:hypothetical protein